MTAYTLFGQPASPAALAADNAQYTMGVQFAVSQAATLTAVWFHSAPGAAVLPSRVALFTVSGATLAHSEAAAWSGAAGSGWVRAPLAAPPSLTPGTAYKAAVLGGDGTDDWYSATAHYWDTGPGAGGITSGPLSAPATSGGDGGQDTFNAGGTLTYPATSFNAANYWVDPEVTVAAPAPSSSGPLLAAFAPELL